jgi:hypothetical protein
MNELLPIIRRKRHPLVPVQSAEAPDRLKPELQTPDKEKEKECPSTRTRDEDEDEPALSAKAPYHDAPYHDEEVSAQRSVG